MGLCFWGNIWNGIEKKEGFADDMAHDAFELTVDEGASDIQVSVSQNMPNMWDIQGHPSS